MRGILLVLAIATVAHAAPSSPALELRTAGKRVDLRQAALLADVTGSRIRFPYGDGTFGTIAVGERAIIPGNAPDSRLRPSPQSTPGRTLSGDGRLVVAGLADGTVRWYAAEGGQELLAWFPHPDKKRWVAFTPSGYYDASVGGEDILGWRVERGEGVAPDFFRAALFRDRFYRPDLMSRVLFSQDERRALKELDAEAGRTEQDTPLLRLLPPVVTILDPPPGALATTRNIKIRFMIRSPSGEAVTGVRAIVRGRSTATRGVSVRAAALQGTLAGPGDQVRVLEVDLPAEDATVVVLAETALAQSEPALRDLRWAGKRQTDAAPRPDLFVLTVGVSAYKQRGLRLDYPAKDASDLAVAFREQQGKRYRHVETRALTDAQATRAGIDAGLVWLRKNATPGDIAVVFLAGHGVNDPATGKYYYLPYEADVGSEKSQLGGDELQAALGKVAGKVLLFLDTCHSGNLRGPRVDLTRLTNELASVESGVVVFAASAGNQTSRESPRWSNGVFTKAVVEGLQGKADLRQTGQITVSMMETYVSERVRELTQEEQTPTTAKPGTVPDFLVATVKPRYKLERKWWFWGAMSVAVAGGIAGILAKTRPWETPTAELNFGRQP